MTAAHNWPSPPDALRWDVWAASDLRLELGDRVRWWFVAENHGYAKGRMDAIARRAPQARPIVDVPVQLMLDTRTG
jgi:hypothetical protein